MEILRTPDACFEGLPGWSWAPRWIDVDGLRMHAVDEGPRDGATVLLLHGEPSWSFLYRKMIPPLIAAGLRAVAIDLVGFGRSDKPASRDDYSYARHVAWMTGAVEALGLRDVTLVCQDWGGLVGLRLVAADPGRFARVVAANTGLPTGDDRLPDAFFAWRDFAARADPFPAGKIVQTGCARGLPDDVVRAYDAPFPDERYKAGARHFPSLVPARPDDPAAADNRAAWASLERFTRPLLTVFGDSDAITRGVERRFQERVPGARGQPHAILERAGHFLQEDAGEALAEHVVAFVARTR